jgi:hypothetical protein
LVLRNIHGHRRRTAEAFFARGYPVLSGLEAIGCENTIAIADYLAIRASIRASYGDICHCQWIPRGVQRYSLKRAESQRTSCVGGNGKCWREQRRQTDDKETTRSFAGFHIVPFQRAQLNSAADNSGNCPTASYDSEVRPVKKA